MRQFHDVNEAHVPLPALYTADVVAVKVGQLRELFLRQTALKPELAHALSKHDAGV